MVDEEKSGMGWEVVRGLDRMAEATLKPFTSAPSFRRDFSNLSMLIAAIAILALGWVIADLSFFSFEFWKNEKSEINKSEVFRNLSLAVIAIIGLSFGIWRAWTAYWQTEISEQGMFTERFSNAIEQLGNDQLPVRLGGIYALWRLAEDSGEKDAKTVFDILCAFVRNPTPDQNFPQRAIQIKDTSGEVDVSERATETEGDNPFTCRPDVQSVLDLIGNPESPQRGELPKKNVMDLHEADLRGANLAGKNLNQASLFDAHLEYADLTHARLENINLWRAHLENANLWGAHLENANLFGAHLENANLWGARLENASLKNAHLQNASLWETHLESADLFSAHLEDANLRQAFLENANLWGAHLKNANLEEARLENANLWGAHLESVNFKDARLENANLWGANLENANLSGAHLEGAEFTYAQTKGVTWPEEFSPPDDVYDYIDDEVSEDDDT
jgi:uncharacterized protein YjbI with pentapeptide repeats